jgi:hypothetical protein
VIFHLHVYSGRICHGSVRVFVLMSSLVRVSRRLAVAADAVGSCVEDRAGQGRRSVHAYPGEQVVVGVSLASARTYICVVYGMVPPTSSHAGHTGPPWMR